MRAGLRRGLSMMDIMVTHPGLERRRERGMRRKLKRF
jgi:hypothetical protein